MHTRQKYGFKFYPREYGCTFTDSTAVKSAMHTRLWSALVLPCIAALVAPSARTGAGCCAVRRNGAGATAVAPARSLVALAADLADLANAAPTAGIQFYEDLWEPDVPDVRLTRSRDGDNGVATFVFDNVSFFNCKSAEDVPKGAITAMTMIDEEGELATPDVSARFSTGDGTPTGLICRYEMTSVAAWDRFIRFMGRYGEANGLNFNKS